MKARQKNTLLQSVAKDCTQRNILLQSVAKDCTQRNTLLQSVAKDCTQRNILLQSDAKDCTQRNILLQHGATCCMENVKRNSIFEKRKAKINSAKPPDFGMHTRYFVAGISEIGGNA